MDAPATLMSGGACSWGPALRDVWRARCKRQAHPVASWVSHRHARTSRASVGFAERTSGRHAPAAGSSDPAVHEPDEARHALELRLAQVVAAHVVGREQICAPTSNTAWLHQCEGRGVDQRGTERARVKQRAAPQFTVRGRKAPRRARHEHLAGLALRRDARRAVHGLAAVVQAAAVHVQAREHLAHVDADLDLHAGQHAPRQTRVGHALRVLCSTQGVERRQALRRRRRPLRRLLLLRVPTQQGAGGVAPLTKRAKAGLTWGRRTCQSISPPSATGPVMRCRARCACCRPGRTSRGALLR